MRRLQAIFRVTSIVLLAGILAAPGWAYTIILKDGSRVQAQEKYEIRDGRAYITLSNGTRTFLDADQIDVPATERANQQGDFGGTGILIDEGTATEPVAPETEDDRKKNLAELIRRGDAGPSARRDRPPATAPAQPRETESSGLPRTFAGFVDLTLLPRQRLEDAQLATALRNQFLNQGFQDVQVYRGSSAMRPLVRVVTSSEPKVMRAMVVAARTLLQLREQFADRLRELELLAVTPSGERGAQFQMDPQMATELMGQHLTPDEFFLQYVQF